MERKTVVRCILAVLMLIYVGFAMAFTHSRAAQQKCKGVKILVHDPQKTGFVTSAAVAREIDALKINPAGALCSSLDLRAMEGTLAACDNIERVNCVLLTNDTVLVEVEPLEPLARVFDRNDQDYFINRVGKRVEANETYHIDVPVISGKFSEDLKPTMVIPYLDYLAAHPRWDALVSSIEVRPGGDIILVPAIRGHVVNMGDTTDIDNKFRRLQSFYAQVMPVKGWQFYDTISLKWRSRVIASKRGFKPAQEVILEEEYSDVDDDATMSSQSDSIPEPHL